MTELTDADRIVAGQVRAELARAQLSVTQLADKVNVSRQYLSRRVTGHTPFSVGDLAAIADVLDVPVSTFTAGLD